MPATFRRCEIRDPTVLVALGSDGQKTSQSFRIYAVSGYEIPAPYHADLTNVIPPFSSLLGKLLMFCCLLDSWKSGVTTDIYV